MPAYEGGVQQRGLASSFGNAQPSLESFGGGVAAAGVTDAAQSLVGEMGKFVLEEKKKADDLAVSEYWSKLNTYQNDRIYNTKDGLMTRRGKNSFGAAEEFEGGFKQFADKLDTELLKSSDQRIAAKKIRDREYGDFDGKIQSHLYKERVSYDEETTKAGLEAAKNDALLNYQTPGKVGAAIQMQMKLLGDHASRTGKGEKWVENETGKLVSGTHADIIERMLGQGNDLAAEAYHKANKGELTGDDSAKIEKALEIGSTLGAAQRAADNAWEKSKGDFGAAVKDIERIKNPKIRDKAMEEIKDKHSIQGQIQKANGEALVRESYAMAEERQKPTADRLAKMTKAQQAALNLYYRIKVAGKEPPNDDQLDAQLSGMSSSPTTRDAFLKADPFTEWRPYLSDVRFTHYVGLQEGLRRGDEKVIQKLDSFLNRDEAVNAMLMSSGIDPKPKEAGKWDAGKKEKQLANFRMALNREIDQQQEVTGKKVTSEEAAELGKKLLYKINVNRPDWLFGNRRKNKEEVRIFELQQNDELNIPEKIRKEIEAQLEKDKIPVNDASVIKTYLSGVQSGR